MSAVSPGPWLARLGPFDRHALSLPSALRGALGVTLPLLVGWLTGHIEYGAYTALGALPAGFTSFEGQTRGRVAGVLVASAGMAVATFVGATTAAGAPWLLPLVVAVWAYATGLAICLGPLASSAVLQWAVALLIAMGLPFGPADAALRSGFVLIGGLLQALLVVASWALRPGAREQASLAASYEALATDAAELAASAEKELPPRTFDAHALLGDANPLLAHTRRQILIDLLEEAERVRGALAALGAATKGEQAAGARSVLSDAAFALEFVGQSLSSPRGERATFMSMLEARIAAWQIPADAPWHWSAEALADRLRAIGRKLQALDAPEQQARRTPTGARPRAAPLPAPGIFSAAVSQLRDHLSPSTEAGRHALRLAFVAALAEAGVQWIGLPQGRWVTLTVLLVLKPDYASTFGRGLHRALGTLLGAGIAAAIASGAHSSPGWLVIACGVSVTLAYAVFRVNYLVYSVPLTTFILLLLTLLGSPTVGSAEERVVGTLLGAVLGLLGYLAWPTWKGATAQQDFAALFEAHRDYVMQLLREFAHPGNVDATRLRALGVAARQARSDAQAAAARLASERPRAPFTPDLAQRLLATVARLAWAELALHTLVLSGEHAARGSASARVDWFATALGDAMTSMAAALRRLEAPRDGAALRRLQADLAAAGSARARAFIAVADGLVDATDTARDLLRDRLPRTAMA
jgi:uncharacterized membrane protein YccC